MPRFIRRRVVGSSTALPYDVVRAYRRARQLEAEGMTASDGGQSEYARCRRVIREMLNRPPWKASPLDACPGDVEPNPEWDLAGALELRKQLDAAAVAS
jgi:hypothetical protein